LVDELRAAKHRSPVKQAAADFDCSRKHVENCVRYYEAAKAAHDEAAYGS
jgi:uncharacterized protein (DUF433 family)